MVSWDFNNEKTLMTELEEYYEVNNENALDEQDIAQIQEDLANDLDAVNYKIDPIGKKTPAPRRTRPGPSPSPSKSKNPRRFSQGKEEKCSSKSRQNCQKCQKSICTDHQIILCQACSEIIHD